MLVPIHLDELSCTGLESRLIDCPANDIGDNNCNHGEDAGVTCREPSKGSLSVYCCFFALS